MRRPRRRPRPPPGPRVPAPPPRRVPAPPPHAGSPRPRPAAPRSGWLPGTRAPVPGPRGPARRAAVTFRRGLDPPSLLPPLGPFKRRPGARGRAGPGAEGGRGAESGWGSLGGPCGAHAGWSRPPPRPPAGRPLVAVAVRGRRPSAGHGPGPLGVLGAGDAAPALEPGGRKGAPSAPVKGAWGLRPRAPLPLLCRGR